MSVNLSSFSDQKTANTNYICALQRAENLAVLGCKNVLELCVGPSLKTLEQAYKKYNINVTGNDIDSRWKRYYNDGKWIIGDARTVKYFNYDAVVIAPPLSRGCSGTRNDSLSIDEVIPSYYDFINIKTSISVFVLPGRSLSTKNDRDQFYKLTKQLYDRIIDIVPLKDKVTKYIDIYVRGK